MDQDLKNFISNSDFQNREKLIQDLQEAGIVNFQYLGETKIYELVQNLKIGLHDSFRLFRRAHNQIYPTEQDLQLINEPKVTYIPVFPIKDLSEIKQKFYLVIILGAPQSGKDTFISMCINTLRHIKYDDYIRYTAIKQSNNYSSGFTIYYEQDIAFLRCSDPGQQSDFNESQFSEELYRLIHPQMAQIMDYRVVYVDNSKVQRLGIQMIYSIQRSLEWITNLDKLVLVQTFNNTKTIKGALFMDKSPIADFLARFQKQKFKVDRKDPTKSGLVDWIIKDRCIVADINLQQEYIEPPKMMDLFNQDQGQPKTDPYMLAFSCWNKNAKHITRLLRSFQKDVKFESLIQLKLNQFRQIRLINQFEESFREYLQLIVTELKHKSEISEKAEKIHQIDLSELLHMKLNNEKLEASQKETIKSAIGSFFLICTKCEQICHRICKYGVDGIAQHEDIEKCQKFNKLNVPQDNEGKCASCLKRSQNKCTALPMDHSTVRQYTITEMKIYKSYVLVSDNQTKWYQFQQQQSIALQSKADLRKAEAEQLNDHKLRNQLLQTLSSLIKSLTHYHNGIKFSLETRIEQLRFLVCQDDKIKDQMQPIINQYGLILQQVNKQQ